MDIQQKNNLTDILSIKLKLSNKDLSCIDDINRILQTDVLGESDKALLQDIIIMAFEKICIKEISFIKEVLQNTELPNKEYLLARFESNYVLFNRDKYNLTDYIFDTLDKNFTGITEQEEVALYQIISRLSVLEGSPEIIKLTMDKIQSL